MKKKLQTPEGIREELKRIYAFDSQNVVAAVVHHEICPLYIESNKRDHDAALEYIATLSKRSQKRLGCKINRQINAYYAEDENGVSCYAMDQAILHM